MSRQPYYPPQGQQPPRQRQPPVGNGYGGQQPNIRGGYAGGPDRGEYGGFAQQSQAPYHDPYAGHNGYNEQQYQQKQYHDDQRFQQSYEEPYQQSYQQNGNGYPPQQHEQRPPPVQNSRSYQYDERFHHQDTQRPPQTNGQVGGRSRRSEDRHRPPNLPLEKRSKSKPRERILPAEPLSPTTISWDNPFPTFNTKKAEKKKHASLDKDVGKQDLGPSPPRDRRDSRPQTSQGNRRREGSRPNTSHSQRAPDHRGPDSPAIQQQHHIPARQAPYSGQAIPNQEGHRPETGHRPAPVPTESMGSAFSRNGPPGPPDIAYEHMSPNQQAIANAEWGQEVIPPDVHYTGGTQNYADPHYNYQRPERPKAQTAQSQPAVPTARVPAADAPHPSPQTYIAGSVRPTPANMRIETSGQRFEQPQHDMPNFDAIPQSANEREDLHVQAHRTEQPAYQKKAYQAPVYQQPAVASPQQGPQGTHANNAVTSPIEQFRFDLPQPGPASAGAGHFPPRGASRPEPGPRSATTDSRLPFSNGPPQGRFDRTQPGRQNTGHTVQAQGHDTGYDQSEYGQDHRNGYDNGYNQPGTSGGYRGVQPLPPAGMNDLSRQYSHSPPQQNSFVGMPPNRPATAGSGMAARPPPVRHYGDRNSSDTFHQQHTRKPSHGSYVGNEPGPGHPIPFRPGLMNNDYPSAETPRTEAPPQISRPPPNRGPSAQVDDKPVEKPITAQELNELQQRVKSNPQDYALGLKFAKKLVQAASVLSNEGGRADQKTTAKNRERYIMDAHKVVKKLVSAGYPDAMFYLADCHGQGLLGLAPDPKEAFVLYQSAAKLNHAPSAYRVAVCCEIGQSEGGGTRQDPLKAIQWYKRAATLGDVPAMYKMGMILTKGLLGQQKNPREALTWLKRAADRADKENPHALHELGLLYENAAPNDYIIRDEGYALQLYTQAAELGYKYSQFRLGVVYEYGLLGQMVDPRSSIAWYSAGAAQGEHQAELALSGWYLTGSDPILAQSDTEAYLWARKSANSGLSKAEYAMGYFTETGIGVSVNLEEAKRWYWKAAAQGFPKAVERMQALKAGGRAKKKERVSRSAVKDREGDCVVM